MKQQIRTGLYLSLCVIIIIASMLLNLTNFFGAIIISLISLVCVHFSIKNDYDTFTALIIFIVTQNIMLIIFSNFINKTTFNILILTKELFVGLTIVIGIYYKKLKKILLGDYIAIVFLLVLGVYALISTQNLQTRLVNFRQLSVPFLLYGFGRVIGYNKEKLFKVYNIILIIGTVLFIFGLIEYLSGDAFWVSLGIKNFTALKGFEKWSNNLGIPKNFYAWDIYELTKILPRRMVSLLAEPISLGYYFNLCLIILLYNPKIYTNKKITIAQLIIFLLGTVLTFTKGSFMFVGIIILGYIYYIKEMKKVTYITTGITVFIGTAILVFGRGVTSINNHLKGLMHNFENITFFGKGLGYSGNYAKLYSKTKGLGAGESFIGTLAGQIGLLGMILFLAFFIYLIYVWIKDGRKSLGLIVVSTITLLLQSFISESAISFIGTGIYFVLMGIYYTYSLEHTLEE
jgi:hypothetical protein